VPGTTPASRDQGPPKLFGIELKWISLITLALQNAFLTIIMHYSRVATAPNKTYSAAAAVLLNELLKGAISTLVALKRIDNDMSAQGMQKESRTRPVQAGFTMFKASRLGALRRSVLSPDCYKLAVPAILYVIQNNLQYVAASNLDVATFQVTYQMKILTTAFFSVLMLGKRLSRAKWCALVMLALGVGIVQLQSTTAPGHAARASSHSKHSLRDEIPEEAETLVKRAVDAATATLPAAMHPFRGFVAVTMACLTSGLAGVYFELLLKSGSSSGAPDLWVRNTQLSLFSLVPAIIPILFTGHSPDMSWFSNVASKFANFNGWAIGTVLTQTFGGLITAIVIRYSDNIMKGFATSLSIIISFLASVALFNYPITFSFVAGACIVLAATFLYNSPSIPDAPPTRTTMAVAPGSPIPTNAPIIGEPRAPSRTSSVINLLAGLGSRPGSRRASGSEAPRPFVPVPPLSRAGSYTSNAGTPFTHSAQNSHTQLSDFGRMSPAPSPSKPSPTKATSGKVRPQLSLDTTTL
jgi:UDP-sugar transporter A1/2/3